MPSQKKKVPTILLSELDFHVQLAKREGRVKLEMVHPALQPDLCKFLGRSAPTVKTISIKRYRAWIDKILKKGLDYALHLKNDHPPGETE